MIDEEAKGDFGRFRWRLWRSRRTARPSRHRGRNRGGRTTSENERSPDPPSESGAGTASRPRGRSALRRPWFSGRRARRTRRFRARPRRRLCPSWSQGLDTPEIANRLNAIEAQAERQNAALAADLSRNRDAVAGLEKRVTALEAAGAGTAPPASDSSERLAAHEKDLQAGIDAERGATSDLTARVAELEDRRPEDQRGERRSRRARRPRRQDRDCARRAED